MRGLENPHLKPQTFVPPCATGITPTQPRHRKATRARGKQGHGGARPPRPALLSRPAAAELAGQERRAAASAQSRLASWCQGLRSADCAHTNRLPTGTRRFLLPGPSWLGTPRRSLLCTPLPASLLCGLWRRSGELAQAKLEAWAPAAPHGCVTSGKSLASQPQFPHLSNGDQGSGVSLQQAPGARRQPTSTHSWGSHTGFFGALGSHWGDHQTQQGARGGRGAVGLS